jgi:hypothetical protein
LDSLLKKDDSIRELVDEVSHFFQETGDLKATANFAQLRVGRAGERLQPSTKKMIESQLLEFLSSNREILNMYLLPRRDGHHTNSNTNKKSSNSSSNSSSSNSSSNSSGNSSRSSSRGSSSRS